MKNEDYFYPIVIPEKKDYHKYMYSIFPKPKDLRFQQLILKALNEIKRFKVSDNKFYKTQEDYLDNKELETCDIYYADAVSGELEVITIVKQLVQNRAVDGIYEIRLDSKSKTSQAYVIRIIIFPYDLTNKIFNHKIVTITYAFDKIHANDANKLTDSLRDSSYRIKQSFHDEEEINRYLVDTEGGD